MRGADAREAVAIVIPTRNAIRTLAGCIESVRAQTWPCQLIVVDNRSIDGTAQLAERFADIFISAGPERSAQRNVGAAAGGSSIVGFIDADMRLGTTVVEEAVAAIASGATAVIVPERTVGSGFWARVRAFERAFYVGHDGVEAARFFRRPVFEALGGFDEGLTGPEDWDLTIRARAIGRIARVAAVIDHDEGRVGYRAACRKKGYYARGLLTFGQRHGRRGLMAAADRPYLRQPWRLGWPHPLLGAGLIALKGGEAVAVAISLARPARRRGLTPYRAVATGRGGDVRAGHDRSGAVRSRSHRGSPPLDRSPFGAELGTVTIIVPAFDEGPGIEWGLTGLWAELRQLGLHGARFVVSDSSSTPATADAAAAWAQRAGASLAVERSVRRRSLKEALNVGLDHPWARADWIVVMVADVVPRDGSLVALLGGLVGAPDAVVAVGSCLPDPAYRSWRRRAGAWQLRLVHHLARAQPPDAIRAEGAFWAARGRWIQTFRYPIGRGSLADDVELSRWLTAANLDAVNAPDAVVYKVPTGSFADFRAQAVRFDRAVGHAPRVGLGALAVASRQALQDPLGALLYTTWRLAARVRRGPAERAASAELWQTKRGPR